MISNKTIELYGDGIGKVQYVQHYGDDLTVCNSARVSFGVTKEELDERDKKLINYLIKHRHTSTLEHCGITLKAVVPLFIRSQHHRHRTQSFNERSLRYGTYDWEFYEPTEFRTQHKSNRQASNENNTSDPLIVCGTDNWDFAEKASVLIGRHHANSIQLYDALIKSGVCREQARGVLPQNLYTEYYFTCNLSNLFKFIDLRIHEGAQWEIVKLAEACLTFALELWPITTTAFIENHSNEKMKQVLKNN